MEHDIKVRVTTSLKNRLKKAADKAGMTMNAEIVRQLEKSFAAPQKEAETQAILDRLADAVNATTAKMGALETVVTTSLGRRSATVLPPTGVEDAGLPPEERERLVERIFVAPATEKTGEKK